MYYCSTHYEGQGPVCCSESDLDSLFYFKEFEYDKNTCRFYYFICFFFFLKRAIVTKKMHQKSRTTATSKWQI